jgi:hypothetical protein
VATSAQHALTGFAVTAMALAQPGRQAVTGAPMNQVVTRRDRHAARTGLIAASAFAAADTRHIQCPNVLSTGIRLLLFEEDAPAIESTSAFRARRLPRQIPLLDEAHGSVLQNDGVAFRAGPVAGHHQKGDGQWKGDDRGDSHECSH